MIRQPICNVTIFLPQRKKLVFLCNLNCLLPRFDIQLGKNILGMKFDRIDTDIHKICDLRIRPFIRQQTQNLCFRFRKLADNPPVSYAGNPDITEPFSWTD